MVTRASYPLILAAIAALPVGAGAHELVAKRIGDTAIEVTGSIYSSSGCISFAGIDVAAPPGAPNLLNAVAITTRLRHSGADVCTQAFVTIPVEPVDVPLPDGAGSGPAFVVNYTVIEGGPSADVLNGEILPVGQ
ncbi:hypothetical protein LA6_001330 [Marinibacterium anthonyi]|nr:hypothetical protein [Paracoccaceae bacterium]QEW19148.1 hypothetical protein LA6_001330 [Marinibacterium anthonyi]